MSKKSKRLGALTVAETQRLLGADEPISVGDIPRTPLGMRVFASLVRGRLISRGGRPTDPAWTIVRKVPMKPETWKALNRCAQQFQGQNIRVSAGQVAALSLERGLELVVKDNKAQQEEPDYELSEGALIEATRASRAISYGWYRQCE